MDFYNRQVTLIVEDMAFTLEKFDIEFNVMFSADSNDNMSEISIYNLSKTTINKIQFGDRVRLSAGYSDKEVNIFQGFIKELDIEYGDVDHTLHLSCDDDIEMFDNKYEGRKSVRAFKRGITAEEVINTLIDEYGFAIGNMRLKNNKVYKRGFIVSGSVLEQLKYIAEECESELTVTNGVIDIMPNRYSEEAYLVELNTRIIYSLDPQTGLIASPKLRKAESSEATNQEELDQANMQDKLSKEQYDVFSLLNPNYKANDRILLNSKVIEGQFVIVEGKHICNETDFITQLVVEHYESPLEDAPFIEV